MPPPSLLHLFLQFGRAGMLGFLTELEREVSGRDSVSMGGRDFALFALLGAVGLGTIFPAYGAFSGIG